MGFFKRLLDKFKSIRVPPELPEKPLEFPPLILRVEYQRDPDKYQRTIASVVQAVIRAGAKKVIDYYCAYETTQPNPLNFLIYDRRAGDGFAYSLMGISNETGDELDPRHRKIRAVFMDDGEGSFVNPITMTLSDDFARRLRQVSLLLNSRVEWIYVDPLRHIQVGLMPLESEPDWNRFLDFVRENIELQRTKKE